MKIQQIKYNSSKVDFKNNNINKTIEIKSITDKKNNQNKIAISAIGLVAASTIYMLIRTDKTRIQKIFSEEKKSLKNKFENSELKIEIKNFKDNKNIKSIDELFGLNKIKEFINNYETILKNPEVRKEHNIQKFSSLLFWGVPGTGKTSAAMGIAKKLDADYIQIDKEFFDSMFVSEGSKRLAEMINQIEQHAKENPKKRIIVFMDEIDGTISIDKSSNSRHSEDLLNTLKRGITYLQEECDNIIFIGATNKDPNCIKSDNTTVILNPAILSRFKYQIEFDLPNKEAIKDSWTQLMKTGSGKNKFTEQQNEIISKKFVELGMSYRDIVNIADKLNREDAVEFCNKKNYNSNVNLIKVLKNDEKIGYSFFDKKNIYNNKKDLIIRELEKALGK